MRVKRSTDQSNTEEGAAQKPKPKRNPAKALYAGDGRFKSIFDESPIGIELYDSDGRLMDANLACLRIFGIADVAQVKGFKLFEDPNLPDKAKAKLRRGKPVRYEAPFDFEKVKELRLYETAKSGIVHLDVLITPVGVNRKAAPQGYLVQVQDITERKQTEEALRRHAEELAALQATTLDLAAQQDLLSLLNTIVERAMALLNAPCGFIYLHDAKTNELELVVQKGLPAPLGLRLRMGEGMAGRVARTRQPLIVDDYSTWESRSPQYADIPYHAIVEVPMLFGGQLIGVLGVNEISAATRRYNEADARLLSLFAGQAASAVRNARLFQGLQSELAERKRTEQALFQTEKRYRTLFEQSPDGILLIDPKTSLPIVFNTAAHSHLGYSREEFARLRIADYEVIEKPKVTEAHIKKIIQEGRDDFETKHRTKQGEIRNVHVTVQTIELAGRPVLNSIFRDITARKQVEERLRQRVEELAALQATVLEITAPHDLPTLLRTIVERAALLINAPSGGMYLCDAEKKEVRCVVSYNTPGDYTGTVLKYGEGAAGIVAGTSEPLIIDDYRSWRKRADVFKEKQPFSAVLSVPMIWQDQVIGVLHVLHYEEGRRFTQADLDLLTLLANHAAIAVENTRLYAAEQRRAERLTGISRMGIEFATLHEASAVLKILVTRAAALMESTTCTVMLIDTVTNEAYLAAQTGLPEGTSPELRVPLELPILRHFVETGEPIIIPDINHDAPAMRSVLVRPDIQAFFAYPMFREGRAIGLITFSKLTPYTPSAEEVAACQLLAERAAASLENARLFEETNRSLRQVQSLHTIDITIASSFDLRLTLNILIEQTRTRLGVDAVDILVYNPHTQVLDYAAGIGFRTTALQGTHLRLGQGYAGIAGLERKTVHVSNLRGRKTDFLRSPNFSAEGFNTYFGVPLIAKGQIKGVLEVFHRSPLKPDQIWTDFLETLAKQAAIAIDNATLFSDLQSSNAELTLAYDTTLTGWSKALDLRDKETEGHTQRVVETTIRLARAMGVIEAELTNVRRGALLHDIGKMGIPDEILHKPGPLSAEEWATMRQHPVHAREMLSPIAYLRPALDIPYNHHEKWDGSGYPNGLKGEQIPLAARIFAVVDVFDALTSDRPYRLAWPREKALDYIREQAGKHFNPAVVEMFLKIVDSIKQL